MSWSARHVSRHVFPQECSWSPDLMKSAKAVRKMVASDGLQCPEFLLESLSTAQEKAKGETKEPDIMDRKRAACNMQRTVSVSRAV